MTIWKVEENCHWKKQLKDPEMFGGILGKTQILYRNHNIDKKIFRLSIIFYMIKEPEKQIHILRVLREEQDWEKILTWEQEYTCP